MTDNQTMAKILLVQALRSYGYKSKAPQNAATIDMIFDDVKRRFQEAASKEHMSTVNAIAQLKHAVKLGVYDGFEIDKLLEDCLQG